MTAAGTIDVRKRITELLAGRDDVVWASLQTLGQGALTAARLLEQRVHQGAEVRQELRAATTSTDEALRHLNRHLHNSFTAPLERDDALFLATALDRVAQSCEDAAVAFDVTRDDRGPHEARRASSLLAGALERLVAALGDLAVGRAAGDAPAEARARLGEARDFVRRGFADILSAQLPMERLLAWKEVYDRLDTALTAARDVERLEDAIEVRAANG